VEVLNLVEFARVQRVQGVCLRKRLLPGRRTCSIPPSKSDWVRLPNRQLASLRLRFPNAVPQPIPGTYVKLVRMKCTEICCGHLNLTQVILGDLIDQFHNVCIRFRVSVY
jgi:hypothetical protein